MNYKLRSIRRFVVRSGSWRTYPTIYWRSVNLSDLDTSGFSSLFDKLSFRVALKNES